MTDRMGKIWLKGVLLWSNKEVDKDNNGNAICPIRKIKLHTEKEANEESKKMEDWDRTHKS